MAYPHVIVLTGPTASGKSGAAIELARRLDCDIISADSRQVFKGMPIITAVPTVEERQGVKHHLMEFLDIHEYYSADKFASDGLRLISEAGTREKRYIIVCGGSMMYIDALLYGLDDIPVISDSVRQRVANIYDESGLEGLNAILSNLDPDYSAIVDTQNTRRVMHGVEICLASGRKASEILTGKSRKPPFSFSKFVIRPPREVLFDRINRRVEHMVNQGMEDEAGRFYPYRHLNSLNTIGFKEWFAYFDGKMDKATAIARIAKNTRVYAKKQLTWLAKQTDNIYVDGDNIADQIVAALQDIDKSRLNDKG